MGVCLWGGKWDGENYPVCLYFSCERERERNLEAWVSGLPSVPNS